MSGIGSIMSIAQQALSAQQSALNVTGQNIANVDNVSYSRQIISFASSTAVSYGNYLLGTGVEVTQVKSACDQLLEERLADQNSTLSSYEQMASALGYLETLFSIDSDTGLNAMLSDFWSSWQDLANSPSGSSERQMVYDAGMTLSTAFNTISENLIIYTGDVTAGINDAVSQVNNITTEIAALNRQIIAYEADGVSCANDLRDSRQALVGELSNLINLDTFEQSNGSIILTTGGGAVLVNGVAATTLEFSGGDVLWNSSGRDVDITASITTGDIGGLLSIRDETIPKYQANLNAMAKEVTWAVNSEHAAGSGLTYFSSPVTGTYSPAAGGLLSTLTYADRIDFSQDFSLWIESSTSDPPTYQEVLVDLSAAAPVDSPTIAPTGRANSVLDTYTFTIDPPGGVIGGTSSVEISWSNATSQGSFIVDAGDVPTAVSVDGMAVSFSGLTGPLPQDTFTITTDSEGCPSDNISSYTLADFAADFNTAAAAGGGGVTASIVDNRIVFSPDSENYSFAFGNTDANLAAAMGVNTFFSGSSAIDMGVNDILSNPQYIAAARIDTDSGQYASGDNANALAMAELQYTVIDIPLWTFAQDGAARSSTLSTQVDDYYQSLVSYVGIESESTTRLMASAEIMVNNLQTQRDAISAVSLDEEMINLTKYQAAYSAASKLLTVADEMFDVLLSIR